MSFSREPRLPWRLKMNINLFIDIFNEFKMLYKHRGRRIAAVEFSITLKRAFVTSCFSCFNRSVPGSCRGEKWRFWRKMSFDNATDEHQNQSNDKWHIWLPTYFIPHFIWLVLVSLVGTFGNILIITSVALNKQLQVISNVFVVNLAVADVIVTSIIIPFAELALFNNADKFFDTYSELCTALGATVVLSCACSVWSIVAISVERYFHICRSAIYSALFNRRSTPVMLLSIWCLAVAFVLPYFERFGWGRFGYLLHVRICTFSFTYYSKFYLLTGLSVAMTIIPYCYIRIYFFVRQSKLRMSQHESKSGVNKNSSTNVAPDTKILKTLAIIYAGFMIMWAPYTANVMFDTHQTWPLLYTVSNSVLCLTNSSINFIIYGIMNRNFRRTYIMVLNKLCHRGSQ